MASSDRRGGGVRYWAVLLGCCAALLAALVLLNLARDPYGQAEGKWYRLRAPGWTVESDTTPDRGFAARRAAARRGGMQILLIGTSKTGHGVPPHAGVVNAALDGLSLEEAVAIVRSATQARVPPRVILVEAMSQLNASQPARPFLVPNWPRWATLMFSARTSWVSLKTLRSATPGQLEAGDPPSLAMRGALVAGAAVPFYGYVGDPAIPLGAAIRDFVTFCRRTGGRVILFVPPIHPALLSSRRILAAQRARSGAYERAVGAASSCRPMLMDLSRPSGRTPAALDPANWSDEAHFRFAVGAEVFAAAAEALRQFGDRADRRPS